MIVSCPSCATRYEMPDPHLGPEGLSVRCRACGYRWVEGRAVQVIDVSPASLPVRYSESDLEAERLIQAAQLAREAFLANRRRNVAERRVWACFAAGLILPIVFLAFYPDMVVRAAPAAARDWASPLTRIAADASRKKSPPTSFLASPGW